MCQLYRIEVSADQGRMSGKVIALEFGIQFKGAIDNLKAKLAQRKSRWPTRVRELFWSPRPY
jgi:hypothetical protein